MRNYFTSAAFEQRARDRERRQLVQELDRVPFVMARLAELNKADGEALLAATRAEARRPVACAPVPLVHPTVAL